MAKKLYNPSRSDVENYIAINGEEPGEETLLQDAASKLYEIILTTIKLRTSIPEDYAIGGFPIDEVAPVLAVLKKHKMIGSYLQELDVEGFNGLISKIASDKNIVAKDDSMIFFDKVITKEEFLNKVVIQFIPCNKLSEEAKACAVKNAPKYQAVMPDWEEDLYRIIYRCIKNKADEFKQPTDSVRLGNIISGLRQHENLKVYFEDKSLNELKNFILKIARDEKAKGASEVINFDGINIPVNGLINKVVLQFIPEQFLSESALQVLRNESTNAPKVDVIDRLVDGVFSLFRGNQRA